MAKRDTPRIQPSTVYLGDKYKRFYREARLKEIAERLGAKGKSELIQKIADGEFEVVPRRKQPA
jgi:hypothetical protein